MPIRHIVVALAIAMGGSLAMAGTPTAPATPPVNGPGPRLDDLLA